MLNRIPQYLSIISLSRLLVLASYFGSLPVWSQTNTPTWQYAQKPFARNWDSLQISKLHRFIVDSSHVTGFMLIHEGKLIYTYGDINENSYIASCRKSILSILYGPHVMAGTIQLDKSLQQLNVDDVGGLLPEEKTASIKDLISARSAVFHLASNPGDYLEHAPPRGSKKPGTYWLYNNWDFNTAGYIFEKLTGTNIYDEVERLLVKPLQMQDWNRSLQAKEGDSTRSIYPSYPIYFSTRDMAKIGQLMLQQGRWNNRQIIPESWIKQLISPITSYREVDSAIPTYRGTPYHFGYGYMWWLWQNPANKHFSGAYSAFGFMGQSITVFPAIATVLVIKTKSDYERSTSLYARLRLHDLAVQAFRSSTH